MRDFLRKAIKYELGFPARYSIGIKVNALLWTVVVVSAAVSIFAPKIKTKRCYLHGISTCEDSNDMDGEKLTCAK